MNKEYKSPVVKQVPLLSEQPICSSLSSSSLSLCGGEYTISLGNEFDSDSD